MLFGSIIIVGLFSGDDCVGVVKVGSCHATAVFPIKSDGFKPVVVVFLHLSSCFRFVFAVCSEFQEKIRQGLSAFAAGFPAFQFLFFGSGIVVNNQGANEKRQKRCNNKDRNNQRMVETRRIIGNNGRDGDCSC